MQTQNTPREIDMKVGSVTVEDDEVEFKQPLAVASLNFVKEAWNQLLSSIEKLSQWHDMDRYFKKKYGYEVGRQMGAVAPKPGKRRSQILSSEWAEKIFDQFEGQEEVPVRRIVDFAHGTGEYGNRNTTINSVKRALAILDGSKAVWDKEKRQVSFLKKTKATERALDRISYDNLKEAGFEPKEARH